MSLTLQAKAELPAPFKPADLREFLATVPDNARATVTTRMGGSQRDPYPTGYLFLATWETES